MANLIDMKTPGRPLDSDIEHDKIMKRLRDIQEEKRAAKANIEKKVMELKQHHRQLSKQRDAMFALNRMADAVEIANQDAEVFKQINMFEDYLNRATDGPSEEEIALSKRAAEIRSERLVAFQEKADAMAIEMLEAKKDYLNKVNKLLGAYNDIYACTGFSDGVQNSTPFRPNVDLNTILITEHEVDALAMKYGHARGVGGGHFKMRYSEYPMSGKFKGLPKNEEVVQHILNLVNGR